MSDNTYGAIYIDLLYDAQLKFNGELLRFVKDTKEEDGGGTEDFKAYFAELTNQLEDLEGANVPKPFNVYQESLDQQLVKLNDFLNTDDTVFEYEFGQAFQDSMTVKSITKYWQNNINSELIETFGKGNQLPYFTNLEENIALYRLAETGSYTKVDNSYPGNYSTAIWCGGIATNTAEDVTSFKFPEIIEAQAAAIAAAVACDNEQCAKIKEAYYDEEATKDRIDALKATKDAAEEAKKDAEDSLDSKKEAKDEAEAELAAAQAEYDNAVDTQATAQAAYDNCIANPPVDGCGELLTELNEAIADTAEALEDLNKAQADYDNAVAEVNLAQQALTAAEQALGVAEKAVEAAEEADANAKAQCSAS